MVDSKEEPMRLPTPATPLFKDVTYMGSRSLQKALEASDWPRFCEASSADSSLVSAAWAEQGPRRVLLDGGLGDLGADTTGKQLSAR